MLEAFMYLPFVIIFVGLVAFIYWFRDQLRANQVKRFNDTHWHKYDALGNPAFFYDPNTGAFFVPTGGNSPVPHQIMMWNGSQRDIVAPGKNRTIAFNPETTKAAENWNGAPGAPGEAHQVNEPSLPALEQRSGYEPPNVQLELSQLTLCKQEGRGKANSIFAVTGCKKGGSQAYEYWSNVWNNIAIGDD